MQQVEQFLAGERNYPSIKGATGPLVYPAIHVYAYSGLYYLTDHGKNILLAQCIFAALYLCALCLAMCCYRKAGVGTIVKPWLQSSFACLDDYIIDERQWQPGTCPPYLPSAIHIIPEKMRGIIKCPWITYISNSVLWLPRHCTVTSNS